MPVLKNIKSLVTCRDSGDPNILEVLSSSCMAWKNGRIEWVGLESSLPERFRDWRTWDAQHHMVLPGLIDCHTHLAFGGWRQDEFKDRIEGISYLDIASRGGGILSTVEATREAHEDELFEACMLRLEQIAELGITTIEAKSGYGLSVEDELKLLRVYRRLCEQSKLDIVSTFLGAHSVPVEFRNDRDSYVDLVVDSMIPRVAEENLAEFCDVFVEQNAFSREEAKRILEAGLRYGLKPKIHADQLSDLDGASLAADVGAVSADHLECISDQGIERMREAGVVAVVLPFASLYTFQKNLDARRLLSAGLEVAVATDFNPGSAPSFHLPMALSLACLTNRMSPAAVVQGATRIAARAICRDDVSGSLEPEKQADFIIVDSPDVDFWLYHLRANACLATVKNGQVVHSKPGFSVFVNENKNE